MYQAQFSHNPLYCVDIIKTYKINADSSVSKKTVSAVFSLSRIENFPNI